MTGTGAVTRALLEAARDAVDERELADRVCRACVDGLDVDGAAMSLLTCSESRVTLAATDPVAQLLEDLQFTLNEGACMEAARTGRPVLVPDLEDTGPTARWPLFAGEVTERTAVAALFALPLQWGAVNLGVLDLYRTSPGRLDDEQWRDAAAAVDTATLMMISLRTDPAGSGVEHPADRPARQVDAGISDEAWLGPVTSCRAEVHQAVGMVQVQLGLSGVDALARMRGHAFARRRLLIDVARDVVERRLVFSDEMP